ncbi:cobaltochelatase subunit CobN, partial [Desertibaculum subflavum]|uniref:cobaltochelatase subunit CobN n=1 Tax=Desertibaculum subflavum TaxID=2268458 RepID=UPI0034D19FEF
MHLLVRESRGLDDDAAAIDLGQSPAELLVLSFSDSDLRGVAAAWASERERLPTLRLANLAQLRHPLSVDLYLERMLGRARAIVVRLLGGVEYWRYGAEQLAASCRARKIPLVLLPGDAHEDARLAEMSTVPQADLARLHAYFRHGGPDNLGHALRCLAQIAGGEASTEPAALPVPAHGMFDAAARSKGGRPLAVVVFYRAYFLAGDTAPITALADALDAAGLDVRALFVDSLKNADCARWIGDALRDMRPAVVVNTTGFSARSEDSASPLDAAQAPVLQAVLSGATREAWQQSARGLSQTDLAMQVVLPELDGRLLAGLVSFKKEATEFAALEFRTNAHMPDREGIDLVARRAAGWARLAGTPPGRRRIALILSDYPNAPGQIAHAVGLDAPESATAMLRLLDDAGYDLGPDLPAGADLVPALCDAERRVRLPLDDYRRLFDQLPGETRAAIADAWGAPEADPACIDGAFALPGLRFGQVTVAIQPDRGHGPDRKVTYHDPDLPPRHAYVAFYLWLRRVLDVDAIVHLGAHGTLEWLPGKAVALSAACHPAALVAGMPVIYPFIVNNPGEAAQAKRRLGAVTIGHLTPPLRTAGTHGPARELEQLIDEYAAADGLDRRRTALLRREILERAESIGLLAESGATRAMPEEDQLGRLDAFLCDVKDMQIRDGLHVFGTEIAPERRAAMLAALTGEAAANDLDRSPAAERRALLDALDGRFVPPGPAGAPSRGRA